jgi:hypothetical protein
MDSHAVLQRPEVLRAILEAPPDVTHSTLSKRFHLHRETVRRFRIGALWADVLPDLPRIPPEQVARTCLTCKLFNHKVRFERNPHREKIKVLGDCTIEIPEARHHVKWARCCNAYVPDDSQS